MDIWYAHLDEDELMGAIRTTVAETRKEAKGAKAAKKKKTEKRDVKEDKLAKLAGEAGGEDRREGAHA